MSEQDQDDLCMGAEGFGFASAGGAPRAARRSSWFGGAPRLPESLLGTTVGDPDVIDRLSRHSHQMLIPTWLCSCCGLAWPCQPAREDLLLDLGWMRVAIYCAVLMERAAMDVVTISPRGLWERFLEWTEPPEEIRDSLIKRPA